MHAIHREGVPLLIMDPAPPLNDNESKVSRAGLESINKSNLEERIEQSSSFDHFIPGIQEKISRKNEKKIKHKKCECISKTATRACCATMTGTGLASVGLFIASLISPIPHSAFCAYSGLLCVGTGLSGLATLRGGVITDKNSRSAKKIENEEISLQKAIESLKKKKYVSFIDSQQYGNLEDLVVLPKFHRYVEVCLLIKKALKLQIKASDESDIEINLNEMVFLRKREDKLANALSNKLNGNFKRFDFSKRE